MTDGESYKHFAFLYDELMSEAPYEKWLDFFSKKVNRRLGLTSKSVLDIGCGTGTLALKLAALGFEVTGVDLSDEMLAVAASKSMDMDLQLVFVQQDMRDLQLGQTFPVVTAFCDVINYLESFEDVKAAFKSIYDHLDAGGLFLFDVHSVYKMDSIFKGASFCSADPELSYIWECFDGPYDHSVEHELSFFVLEENGMYSRFDETHQQRTFDIAEYVEALETSGLKVLSIEGDFEEGTLNEKAERLFFTVIKEK